MKKILKALASLFFVYLLSSGALAWYATTTYRPSLPFNTSTLGFRVEDVTFKTEDNIELRGWYSEGAAGAPAIAIFHGFRCMRTDDAVIGRTLSASGYNMLLVDMRGCGESGGRQSLGAREALDIRAAIQYLQIERRFDRRRIGMVAVGTSASAAILAHEDVSKIGAAALLGPYEALDESILRRFQANVGVNGAWMSALAKEFINLRIGRRSSLVRPVDVVAKLTPCPVLFVAAGGDSSTPPEEIQRLFDAAAEPKELYIAPGAPRDRLTDLAGSDLRRELTMFFDNNLK
ncbi:MAG: hypothetical protein HY286_17610 [Planctomycetes bacterium]|nr:hypothetical protein [Planctomycetota bacterium]